ncbi:M14 metallopeptidase family protein [Candidatus Latescibacterota bacterium]
MIRKNQNSIAWYMMWFSCTIFIMLSCGLYAQESKIPFYPDGTYTTGIPTPEEILGFSIGEKPVRYEEAVRYMKALADASDRVVLFESGETHEKRKLYYLVVSSEENLKRWSSFINDGLSKLADPRTVSSDNEAQTIIDSIPAVVWMMYSIHGDELSGTDSSLQLAYQLAAGSDLETEKIRRELLVGIDSMENPDGRERYLAQIQQWAGSLKNWDGQSIQHTGSWPWGRTNHYLFDLNRDWFILAHPESRARIRTFLEWKPQVVVDAHEMGPYDTYLFSPSSEPINPNIHQKVINWWKIFSADQAKTFDRYGWSYYTREWADEWYPGYSSSFPSLSGGVGILYEQAQTDGTMVKRPDQTVLTFREAVHHHFTSSYANILTAANNRKALLNDYYSIKKEVLSPPKKAEMQAYYIIPGDNPARARRLVNRLLMQGIEVEITQEPVNMKNLLSYWNTEPVKKTLPEGTYVIRLSQPLRPLINAILEFDPHMTTAFLQSEREYLEKGKGTRMYETSAWSMLMAYHVDSYCSAETPPKLTVKIDKLSEIAGDFVNSTPAYGYIIDYRDDSSIDALIALFEKGYTVHAAKKPFQLEGRSFLRGSLLVRIQENSEALSDDIRHIASSTNARVYGVNTALSQEGPDLGGREFQLLTAPRIAILTGPEISMAKFGALWYMLDYELNCRHSVVNCEYLNNLDLRKYNVLIMPSAGESPETYRRILSESSLKKIKDWVTGGGTLIGIGTGAAFLADSTTAFSSVKLRSQALKELDLYKKAVLRENEAGKAMIDSLIFWEGTGISQDDSKEKSVEKMEEKKLTSEKPSDEELTEQDKRLQLFMPRGAILRTNLDEEHWMSFGVGDKVPAIVYTQYAFLSKTPVQTSARFSEASILRLSGLLWPEARERWEKTAYATREAYGKGQVILFADEPNFRSYFYGTGRMLINSMLLGPGFGTQQVVEW